MNKLKTPEELALDIVTYVRDGNPYDDVTLEQVTKMIERYTTNICEVWYTKGKAAHNKYINDLEWDAENLRNELEKHRPDWI